MRKLATTCSIIFGLSAMLLTGCMPSANSGSSDESRTPDGSTEQATSGERGFDPMEFRDDRVNVPRKNPRSGDLRGKVEIISTDSSLSNKYGDRVIGVPDEVDSLNSQAFRVQIFTSKVFGESRQAMRIGEEIFDRPLFLDYEVPYFKVRVGNFPDRESAEDYMVRVKASGYSSAWVVLVNIAIKETAPLYDKEYPELYLDSVLNEDSESEGTSDGKSPKP